MRNDAVFAARVKRIEKASRSKRRVKTRSCSRLSEKLITPLMLIFCLSGGMTAAWDAMDRPTDTPFELAEDLTVQLLDYLATI